MAIEFYLLAIFYTSNVNRPYLIKNKKGFLLQYYYRVKTLESIDDKINRYSLNTDQYPVNNWLNDIFGARIILNTQEVEELSELLDGWQEKFGLKNWYFREALLHKDLKDNTLLI
ncbi:hypothetical protein [Acinetobacter ursingii]|uniref:hypothetical protein n=1 Tax=Acinetobacter ursingii TaxID=108980 RepID=UPI0002CE3EF5|nr:hypothetical protein [Acinetobacter ursingii]ENV75945.1 hypothetical protein F944_01819 [Acinetobacter ursingii DSM 16037 = CIP 107286]